MTPDKWYRFSGGSRPEHRRQQHCLTLHKGGTAERLTSTVTSERVVDLWLPPLTHSDISLRRDYQCTLWRVWKRSAATIRFSHFCPRAPAADEADIILQTVANRICSFWIQIFPRLTDLISSLLKMRHMWSKWMVRSWGIWMWFSNGKVFLEIFMWGHIWARDRAISPLVLWKASFESISICLQCSSLVSQSAQRATHQYLIPVQGVLQLPSSTSWSG